jgi:hypothetical protein
MLEQQCGSPLDQRTSGLNTLGIWQALPLEAAPQKKYFEASARKSPGAYELVPVMAPYHQL